jgi:DNA-binding beta-propeller fold protein YncE/predicted flap endonuclease-1-like 5' DNA nuclease
MILRVVYDGGADPFEGERELPLRRLPADARVIAARATVTPVDASEGTDPFAEEISFIGASGTGGGVGGWGATQVRGPGWAEIDFHARRTLAGLRGSALANAGLQIDLGGSFVAVGATGALAVPGGQPLQLTNDGPVPGIAASRLRVVGAGAGSAPVVTAVRIRSLPANVTLALAGRPALWFQAGELAAPVTTPDFGALLAAYLADGAEVADGAFVLPFLLHSDAIARLQVELEIEYLRRAALLPAGLPEVKLGYDHATVPRAGSAALVVALPAGAAPVAAASEGKAAGPFGESRIAWGPVGETTSVGAAALSPSRTAAQALALPERVDGYEVTGIDLALAAIDRKVKLLLDLRVDEDGKPGAGSLLAAPVPFELARAANGGEAWVQVELPRPLTLRGEGAWLLLQSAEGEAAWSVGVAAPGAVPLQASMDGGFSYRAATVPGRTEALAALFRLREQPRGFRMPLSIELGTGAGAVRVGLNRLSPVGRVDFPLSTPELAVGLAAALGLASAAAGGPAAGELLADPRFARWAVTGDELGRPGPLFPLAAAGERIGDSAIVGLAPDGRMAYFALDGIEALRFLAWDTDLEEVAWRLEPGLDTPRGLAIDPAGRFAWVLLPGRVAVIDLAERRLLGAPLAVDAQDTLPNPVAIAVSGDGAWLAVAGRADANGLTPASVAIYDAESFAALARRGAAAGTEARLGRSAVPSGEPVAVALSADGARLWVLTAQFDADGGSDGELLGYDARTLAGVPAREPFAGAPRALAAAPDGRSVLVLHAERLDRYGTAPLALDTSLPLPGGVGAGGFSSLVIEPGGRRALLAGAAGLSAVTLPATGLRLAPAPTGAGASAGLAVSPQGDRAVLAQAFAGNAFARILPIGVPRPLDWTATAGRVLPLTLSGAAGLGARLGEAAASFQTSQTVNRLAPPGPSALSQVVAVVAGRTYEITFQAQAGGEAVAEVLWRGAAGEQLGVVAIPIENRASSVLHRGRSRAPEGAVAAEIRFVAVEGTALIRNASFREPANALVNADLLGAAAPLEDTASGWRREPAAAPGFLVSASGGGSRVRNAGAVPVVLRQEVAVEAGVPFELVVGARLEGAPAGEAPRIELRFLAADGAAVGSPTAVAIPARGFGEALAAGEVPAGAARAAVALAVPPGRSLLVTAIELHVQPPVRIPVTFLAEAPGELAVIGGAIAWDVLAAPPGAPAPPRPGPPLPPPTPPEGAAGEHDDCGCDDAAAPASTLTPVAVEPVAVVEVRPAEPLEPIAIAGIGPRRAAILRDRGVATLDALIAADPRELARVLPTVSERMALDFVRQARELLRQR